MATQFGSAYGSGLEFFYNSGLPQRTRRRAGDDEDDKRIIPTQARQAGRALLTRAACDSLVAS